MLSSPGEIDADNPALARELAVNRYERIEDFDFSAGDLYWEETAAYWKEVRVQWTEKLGAAANVKVETTCNDTRLYETLFALASEKASSKRALKKRSERMIETIECAVSVVSDKD